MTERAKERAGGASSKRVPCATCGHEKLRHRLRRYLVYLLCLVAVVLVIPALMVWAMAARLLLGKPFGDMPITAAWDAFWEQIA